VTSATAAAVVVGLSLPALAATATAATQRLSKQAAAVRFAQQAFSHHEFGGPLRQLRSLGAGVRAAAFMVPGALGVLEGSYVAFCALFGLPAETALTIALSKRVRELALGLPGLIVWHWVEGRRLLRRG